MFSLQSSVTNSVRELKRKLSQNSTSSQSSSVDEEDEDEDYNNKYQIEKKRSPRSKFNAPDDKTIISDKEPESKVIVFVRVGEHTRLVNLPPNSSLRCLRLRMLHSFDCEENFEEKDLSEDSKLLMKPESEPDQKHYSYMIVAIKGKNLRKPRVLRRSDLQSSCTITVVERKLLQALSHAAKAGRFPKAPYIAIDSESDFVLDRLNNFFNVPSSSYAATCWAILIIILIVLSTCVFCLETIPSFYDHNQSTSISSWSAFMTIEACCIATFTFEYVCRLLVARKKISFAFEFLNLIDLISILPFYIEMISSGDGAEVPSLQVLRVIRLVRVFRLFKVSKGALIVLANTISRSLKPLYMLFFMSIVVVIVCASVTYYCERGKYNEGLGVWMRPSGYLCNYTCTLAMTQKTVIGIPQCEYVGQQLSGHFAERAGDFPEHCLELYEQSPFESIPQSAWWAFTTISTVGYGDVVPTSTVGRIMAMATMLVGILTMGLPITVIGSNFSELYQSTMADDANYEDE